MSNPAAPTRGGDPTGDPCVLRRNRLRQVHLEALVHRRREHLVLEAVWACDVLPLVVRLEGNNVEAGRQTLADSGLALITASSLAEAAQKSVEAAK